MNRYDKNNRQLIFILSFSGIIIGCLLIIVSRFTVDFLIRDLTFGFGLALAPSGILGLIGDYLVFGRTMESLNESNEMLARQVLELRISTEYLKQSSKLGLEMVYPERELALRDFTPLMREQAQIKGRKGKLIIVGSSIHGLLKYVHGLEEIIQKAIDNDDCELHILLTHPEYSHFRENQEIRPPGAIEDEIFNSIRLLENNWEKCTPEGKKNKPLNKIIKLYKGTPTCFMIIAGDKMLLNPYPYEKEAFESFCFSVRKVELESEDELEKSIYQQYCENHFESPWNRNSLTYDHYFLEGPIPNVLWNHHKQYGDMFVVQDSGEFYIAIYLTGEKGTEIKGIPRAIPYAKKKGGIVETLKLGTEFSIRLLKVTSDTSCVEWVDLNAELNLGKLKLNDDRRSGKFSSMIVGNLINEYDMVGLFEESKESPFFHIDSAEREGLRNKPLPLFYYWLKDKPEMPENKN